MSSLIDILVVDDDPDICHFFDILLTDVGYRVTTLGNPFEAIRLIQNEPKFKLVLLDIRLPEINGIETLEDIKRLRKDIPVILMTGNPSMETAVEAMKFGASDYIKKPFESNEFILEIIARILNEYGFTVDVLESLHVSIGKKIRISRKEKNATLKNLAQKTGLSVSLISQIERAESSASIKSLFLIASCLELSLFDLFEDY